MWSRKLAWRCFLCASVACFTLAQLHPRRAQARLPDRASVGWVRRGRHPRLLHRISPGAGGLWMACRSQSGMLSFRGINPLTNLEVGMASACLLPATAACLPCGSELALSAPCLPLPARHAC